MQQPQPVAADAEAKRRRKSATPAPASASGESSMLELFTALASWRRPVRLDAAKQLVVQLQATQAASADAETMCEDVRYTFERLTFGLASGAEGVRQGYAVVLTELLHAFPFITISELFRIVDAKMVSSQVDDEKQLYFGRIFAVLVVLRSGRLATMDAAERKGSIQKCTAVLAALLDKKSYLSELCAHSLIELMGQLKGAPEFEDTMLPAMQQPALLKVAPDDCSPESLALLLFVQQRFQLDPARFGAPEWGSGDLLAAHNMNLLQNALRASSAAHPRAHFVWKLVVDRAFSPSVACQQQLWAFIDQLLFSSHVDNRKYLGFLLLIEFIRRASSARELIGFLSSPHCSKCLVNHMLHQKKSKMGEIAVLAVSALTERVTANAELGLALMRALMGGSLHSLASLDLGQYVLPVLSTQQGVAFVRDLLARTVTAAGTIDRAAGEALFSTLRRGWKRWAAATTASGNGEPDAELAACGKDVLRLLARVAYMDTSAGGGDKKDYELLARVQDAGDGETRAWARQRLQSLLVEFEGTGQLELFDLVQWVAPHAEGGRREGVAKALKVMGKALRKRGRGDQRYLGAFVKVMGLVALRLVDEEPHELDEALALCDDVTTAFREFRKASAVKARNKAVLVLVSALIQMLTTSSLLHRVVVTGAFRMIAPVVPATGIMDIVKAIVSTEGEQDDGDDDGEGDNNDDDGDDHDDGDKHANGAEQHGLGDEHKGHKHGKKKSKKRAAADEDDEDDEEGGDVGNAGDDDGDWSDVDGGVELPTISLDDADPEYLRLVEDKLAAVFRAMKQETTNKKEAGRSDLDFKLRVVDLLESFARSLPRVATLDPAPFASAAEDDSRAVLFVALPLLLDKLKKTQHSKSLLVLNQKLTRIVMTGICEIRDWPSMVGHEGAINGALLKLFRYASHGNPSAYMLTIVERTIVFLVKVLSRESLLDSAQLATGFVQVLRFAGTKKHLAALNVEKFLGEIWRRSPDAALRIVPQLAEASTDKAWSQITRQRMVAAMAELITKHGKLGLMKDGQLALPAVHSVERVAVAWLRFEVAAAAAGADKAKPTKVAVLASMLAHLTAAARVLLDSRVSGGQFNTGNIYEALPNRDDIVAAVRKLMERFPALANASKVQKDFNAFLKLVE